MSGSDIILIVFVSTFFLFHYNKELKYRYNQHTISNCYPSTIRKAYEVLITSISIFQIDPEKEYKIPACSFPLNRKMTLMVSRKEDKISESRPTIHLTGGYLFLHGNRLIFTSTVVKSVVTFVVTY